MAFVALSKCRLFVALKRYIVPSLATTINVYNRDILEFRQPNPSDDDHN